MAFEAISKAVIVIIKRGIIILPYLWVNKNGKLMEEIITYSNDKLLLGTRSMFLGYFDFKPFFEIGMNTSTRAGEEYQKIFKPFLLS